MLSVVSPSMLMSCTKSCSLLGLTMVVSLNIAAVAVKDNVVAAVVVVVDEALVAASKVGSPGCPGQPHGNTSREQRLIPLGLSIGE